MPYIKQDKRESLDPLIKELAKTIRNHYDTDAESMCGNLNYAVSTLLDLAYEDYEPCYSDFNEKVGVLECAKLELYARLARPYEDYKLKENGDVYSSTLEKIQKKINMASK